MPGLRVVGLTKRFGSIAALEDVDLNICEREYVSIIGPSGCGKSTLIKCIAGIVDPDKGEIFVHGNPMRNMPIQRRRIGYVFQEVTLFPHMRILENVSYGPRVQGQKPRDSRALVTELLDLIKLADRADSFPHELSGGAQQKVAVSRALASGSTLLLFDEPFGALDAKVRTELRYEVRRMAADLGLTVLHVTHDQEEAMSISDRIVIMKKGRIVEEGPPLRLYMSPKKIFTANFLGEANFLEGKVMGQSDCGSVVQIGDILLQTSDKDRKVGEDVVIAIRPEFVSIARHLEGANCLTGRVRGIRFIGNMIRYEVEVRSGKILFVERPISFGELDIKFEDEVTLKMTRERVAVYSVPEVGLEEELRLE